LRPIAAAERALTELIGFQQPVNDPLDRTAGEPLANRWRTAGGQLLPPIDLSGLVRFSLKQAAIKRRDDLLLGNAAASPP
jgi:hypothetical protein